MSPLYPSGPAPQQSPCGDDDAWRRLDTIIAELKRSVEARMALGDGEGAGRYHDTLCRVEHMRREAER